MHWRVTEAGEDNKAKKVHLGGSMLHDGGLVVTAVAIAADVAFVAILIWRVARG